MYLSTDNLVPQLHIVQSKLLAYGCLYTIACLSVHAIDLIILALLSLWCMLIAFYLLALTCIAYQVQFSNANPEFKAKELPRCLAIMNF